VSGKDCSSRAGKPFCEDLQGHGFACASSACNKTMTVAKRKSQILVRIALANQYTARLMRGVDCHMVSSGGAREDLRITRYSPDDLCVKRKSAPFWRS